MLKKTERCFLWMVESLTELGRKIISSFGMNTSRSFKLFSKYFLEIYGEEFKTNEEILKNKMDYLKERGIFEIGGDGNYVLVVDSLEHAAWKKSLNNAFENMTSDDLDWMLGTGRYSQS